MDRVIATANLQLRKMLKKIFEKQIFGKEIWIPGRVRLWNPPEFFVDSAAFVTPEKGHLQEFK